MSFFGYSKSHEEYFVKNGQKVVYGYKRYIVTSTDNDQWVYFLKKGLVRVSYTLLDGKERLIGYFVPGVTFAKSGTFFDSPDGTLEYTTGEESVLYRLPRDKFLSELKNNEELSSDYMNMVLRNQIFLIDRVVYQGENGIHRKLLRWLLFMAKYYGNINNGSAEIIFFLSQEEIANFLHVTRVSVNNTLSFYTKKGVITTKDRKIYIPNLDRIKELLE